MRGLLMLLVLCSPATARAWTFSPDPICTIAGTPGDIRVEVTFDPATALYALHVTRPAGWPDAPVMALRFHQGMGEFTISTDRHIVEGPRLSVTDSGFGNVLRGLEFFGSATLSLGNMSVAFDTSDAAPAVAAFRDCPETPSA